MAKKYKELWPATIITAILLLENHFTHQLLYLFRGYNVYDLLGWAAALILFGYRWHEKSSVLKCWLALLPVLTMAFIVNGHEGEYRTFYETFPALTLLASSTVATILDQKLQRRYGAQGS